MEKGVIMKKQSMVLFALLLLVGSVAIAKKATQQMAKVQCFRYSGNMNDVPKQNVPKGHVYLGEFEVPALDHMVELSACEKARDRDGCHKRQIASVCKKNLKYDAGTKAAGRVLLMRPGTDNQGQWTRLHSFTH